MELLTFGKEVLHSIAEHAVSYRTGQAVLRQLDKVLWVVEKTARWAVPPPLDQDERPQPELVRPLPWVFFLALLATLRVTRDSISLLHLMMGKPPLRSADVVMFVQHKRRYLRTLKYQGNRMMRARIGAPRRESWWTSIQTLFEFTMCFRRTANNNSTRQSNNEQVLVVKHSSHSGSGGGGAGAGGAGEGTMERLIEKMMIDLNADSDDDSCYTLTNATSIKTDSEPESEQDTVFINDASDTTLRMRATSTPERQDDSATLTNHTPEKQDNTPEKQKITPEKQENTPEKQKITPEKQENTPEKQKITPEKQENTPEKQKITPEKQENTPEKQDNATLEKQTSATPEKQMNEKNGDTNPSTPEKNNHIESSAEKNKLNDVNDAQSVPKNVSPRDDEKHKNDATKAETKENCEDKLLSVKEVKNSHVKEESKSFLQAEKCSKSPSPKNAKKIANGRVVENSQSKKKENARH